MALSAASSRITATPTTTYSYTFTTYSNSLSKTSFTKPTIVPSLFSFAAAPSCSKNSVSGTPLPSNFPQGTPLGLEGGCVISNAKEINDHAFWDLYECCKGGDVSAFGSSMPCTGQCKASNGRTFQDIGDCLSKRVEVVVCKPPFDEIPKDSSNNQTSSRSALPTLSGSASASGSRGASSAGGQTSQSNSAGTAVGVSHDGGSKVAMLVFGLLAAGSAVGMLL